MTHATPFSARTFLCAGVLLMALTVWQPGAARASVVIPPRHLGELTTLSEAVVLARAGTPSSRAHGGLILTDTRFEIIEVVHGPLTTREHLTVATQGGQIGDLAWSVAGSPTFSEGTIYLLFLNRSADGTWQPRMMAYGLMEHVEGPDGTAMLTHLYETHDVELLKRPDGITPEPLATYYEASLLSHLRQVAAGRASWNQNTVLVPEALRPVSHETTAGKTSASPPPCEYLEYNNYPVRWNTFDSGGTVNIYAEVGGDVDLAGDTEFQIVQQGINAWNNISGVTTNYHWAGTNAYTPECGDEDASPDDITANQGLVQFNDPCNQMDDLVSCAGVLAIGGSYFYTGTEGRHTHRDEQWNTSVIAYVIVNNGVGSCLSTNQYQSMMTHELGHTLGFGHIPVGAATSVMNPTCCKDMTDVDEMCALYTYSDVVFPSAPATIQLTSPTNGATGLAPSLTLAWQDDPDADFYHLQISTTTNFSNIVLDTDQLTEASMAVGPLAPNTKHYWRVRGINAVGLGDWSIKYNFTTELTTPSATSLVAPKDNVFDQPHTLAFEWNATPGADFYHLQVSTQIDFSTTFFDDEALTTLKHEVTGLAEETVHYWRVRAINAAGPGPWSEVHRLTTLPSVPAAVTPAAPADDALDQPVTLNITWNENPDAETYHLQLSTAEDFSEIVFDDRTLPTTRNEVGPLMGSTTYYWRVRAINRAGNGPWSPTQDFTTRATVPAQIALASPANNAPSEPATLTLAWQPDYQAATYQLQVSTTEDFSETIAEVASLTEPEYELGPLTGNTTYYWRVRATNAVGAGPWSETWTFKTPFFPSGTIALTAPEDGALDQGSTITFEWQPDANAQTYDFQVSTTANFSQLVAEAEGLTETSYEAGILAYSTTHYWRVRGVNALGAGQWSAPRSFTVAVGTGIESTSSEIPAEYRLHQNYPNPFNPQTTLRFDLPASGHVTLVVYDVLGRAVETLVDGPLKAGSYTYTWDAGALPSGLYLARVQSGSFQQTRQLTLLK